VVRNKFVWFRLKKAVRLGYYSYLVLM